MFGRDCTPFVIVVALSGVLYSQDTFSDRCGSSGLPFAAIEVKRPIDSSCGMKGSPSASQNSQIQNEVKDNFCAELGNAALERFTVQMLVDLQGKTKVASGYRQEPSDRKALQQLGEGKVVRIKAHLFEAHYADLGGGESVNCNGGTEAENYVHIAWLQIPTRRNVKA